MINMSIQNGIFPSKLKIAKIVPVFKSGDETDPDNYKPISLLSIFNRIFEKVMYSRLISFMDKHNVLSSSQCSTHNMCADMTYLDILVSGQTEKQQETFKIRILGFRECSTVKWFILSE
jgi:hypothetical protein